MTANNNLVTNFNVDPYYDDFDAEKNFHRILYRPGFAVQARELTQQQTILQNQIHRFGNHIFRDGSEVSGTSEFLDQVGLFRLKATYGGSAIDISSFEDKFVRTRNSQELYKVKKAVAAAGGDFNHIYVQYIQQANTTANSEMLESLVSNNEVIDFGSSYINANNVFFPSANAGAAQILATGDTNVSKLPVTRGFLYSADESVHYHKGLFIRAPKQTIAIAPNTSHIMSIGYTSTETLVNSDTDDTLTDPARGSYNYTAPGADRLKVDLVLTAKPISDVSAPPLTSNNYFEIARVKDGAFISKRSTPDYSLLGDVLAQRTFEESGNYSVEGLTLRVANTDAATSNLAVRFSPGTAYVQGYRVRVPGNRDVPLPKGRQKDTITEQKIETLYGNFVVANTFTTGIMGVNERVELHDNVTPGSATKVGEALIKNIEYLSGTEDQRTYKVFLYDIRITSGNRNLNHVKSVIKGTHSAITAKFSIHSTSVTSFSKTGTLTSGCTDVRLTSAAGVKVGMAVINNGFVSNTFVRSITFDTVSLSSTATVSNTDSTITFEKLQLSDQDFNRSFFLMPHTNVANVINVDYKFKRKFSAVSFSSGSATIQTDGGSERFPSGAGSLANENFIVVIKSGGTGNTATGSDIDMARGNRSVSTPTATAGNPASATLNLDNSGFNGTADILAAIDVTNDTRRAKTRNNGTTKTFQGGTPDSSVRLSLGYADVIKINSIHEGNSSFVSANTDQVIRVHGANANIKLVTDNYIFDNGQRDNFYDHATIQLKPGLNANTNQILVNFDYYAHGGGRGYFSDKSYPDYNNIPTYRTQAGENINLRDVLDFRPSRSSNTNCNTYSTTKIFDNHQIVDSQSFEAEADYQYYKKVIHKISLDRHGEFVLTSGEPALNNPPMPFTSNDTMLLATFFVNPYTYNENDLRVKLEDNARYTMRDIASIDKRVENLEYYTSLNLLETKIATQQFLDSEGESRFKNGFLVDPFKGHSVGNVFDPEYKAAIDRSRQVMRPTFTSDNTPLVGKSGGTLTISSGGIVTLPFTESNFLSQTIASSTINVNPFQVVSFVGHVDLTPPSDTWVDNVNAPTVVVNNAGDLDHYENLKNTAGYEYGDWQATGESVHNETPIIIQGTYKKNDFGTGVTGGVFGTTISQEGRRARTKIEVQVLEDTSTSTQLTNSVYYPYMRSKKVSFSVTGARPNSRLYLLFGGINISDHMAPSTFASTRPEQVLYATEAQRSVVTDAFGAVEGFFWVPNSNQTVSRAAYTANPNAVVLPDLSNANLTDDRKFAAGVVEVILTDNHVNPKFSTSFCTTTFSSRGRVDTYQTTTTTTRRYQTVRKADGFDIVTKTTNADFLDSAQTTAEVLATMNTSGLSEARLNEFVAIATNTYETHIGRKPDVAGFKHWVERAAAGEFGPTGDNDSLIAMAVAIRTAARNNANDPNINCEFGADPLSQTFTVPSEFYPNGIFATSVDIFIAQKDANLPLHVELRPTVNGFPSADESIPLSRVSLNPSDINANASTPTATNVAFKAPIHLIPGEYAVVMLTDSLDYISYIATIGEERLDGTGLVTSQPTLGSLFKSQNARTWTPVQESDLVFRLKQAQFTAGSNKTLTMSSNNVARAAYNANTTFANTNGKFDLVNIVMPKFDSLTPLKSAYEIKTKDDGGSIGSFIRVLPNQDLVFTTSKEITANDDLQVKVTFATDDTNISPYFDLQSSAVTLVKNVINAPPTGEFVAETEPTNGYADAKYITRKVTLEDGLDARSLKVLLDQNMPEGSTAEVYYRVINKEDETNFEDRPYVLMSRKQATVAVNQEVAKFNEYEYFADNITYTQGNATFDNFNGFSIKIVMYSTSTAAAPSFRNFRAIAFA